jgi:DNA-binding CsgD family transcriptional regulator
MARAYGLTNQEIGAELGITEGAVRAILKNDGDLHE